MNFNSQPGRAPHQVSHIQERLIARSEIVLPSFLAGEIYSDPVFSKDRGRSAEGGKIAGFRIKMTMSEKIVFMGSPEFALPTLRLLAAHFHVVGVITQPDRPAGRGQTMTSPPMAG